MQAIVRWSLRKLGLALGRDYASLRAEAERLTAEVERLQARVEALLDGAYDEAPVIRIHHAAAPPILH